STPGCDARGWTCSCRPLRPWRTSDMRADLPVVPDRDTAREWLAGELSKPEYAERESLLVRLINWLIERLTSIEWPSAQLSGPQVGLVVVVVVVVVLLVAWLVAGPVRLGRAARPSGEVLDAEDTRTAA